MAMSEHDNRQLKGIDECLKGTFRLAHWRMRRRSRKLRRFDVHDLGPLWIWLAWARRKLPFYPRLYRALARVKQASYAMTAVAFVIGLCLLASVISPGNASHHQGKNPAVQRFDTWRPAR